MTVFLQGAAGDALPLEAFRDDDGALVAADVFGQRIALEAAHAIADADPWPVEFDRSDWGSVTPISLYRRRVAEDPPAQPLRTSRRIVSLPLLDLPSVADLERELAERKADLVARGAAGETRVTMNPIRYHISWLETTLAQEAAGGRPTAVDGEIWAARIGECAVVGAPGEIFGAIGTAVRAASPAPVTIFAGYSQGSLGYVATPDEYSARRLRAGDLASGLRATRAVLAGGRGDHRADRPGVAAGAVRVTGHGTKVSLGAPGPRGGHRRWRSGPDRAA